MATCSFDWLGLLNNQRWHMVADYSVRHPNRIGWLRILTSDSIANRHAAPPIGGLPACRDSSIVPYRLGMADAIHPWHPYFDRGAMTMIRAGLFCAGQSVADCGLNDSPFIGSSYALMSKSDSAQIRRLCFATIGGAARQVVRACRAFPSSHSRLGCVALGRRRFVGF